uniref:Acyl-CoA_dh_1 domain-containing protein n=1 Tax=Mesocestoides corti TaxID=53468 RepID=A0A5K3ES15_MESCO
MIRRVVPSVQMSLNHWRFLSTSKRPALDQTDEERLISPSLKKFFNRTSIAMEMPNMTRKYAESNASLIPSYFLGKLQLELLEYPELATREEVTKIHSLFGIVEDFAISVDSKSIDRSGVIPPQLMASCKEMGLFGQRVDPKFGGLGMTALESTVVAEALAYDASLFATLTCHEALGVKGLQMVGTDAQKEKYLPALASGEKMGAFCLAEVNSGTDVSSLLTRASLSADGKFYILNGRKAWVANGSRADLFTVFARTSIQNDKGESEEKVTAFLVERGLVGVQVEPPVEKLGLRGLDLVNVTFNNVRVPVENVLGEPGCGAEVSSFVGSDSWWRTLPGGRTVRGNLSQRDRRSDGALCNAPAVRTSAVPIRHGSAPPGPGGGKPLRPRIHDLPRSRSPYCPAKARPPY